MTGEEMLKYYMTRKERTEFINNMDEHGSVETVFYLKGEYKTMYRFVTGAFTWNKSEQGHDYWSKIAKRLVPFKLQSRYENIIAQKPELKQFFEKLCI